jgi:DNA-binding Lrp family transcriptional regulator
VQEGFPLSLQPYRELADQLAISESELLDALDAMRVSGLIRRIGVVPNHYALGYSSNLMVVWDVDDRVADEKGAIIGELDFVSHCYRRPRRLPDWRYNLFAMVHGKSDEETTGKISQIRGLLGDTYRDHAVLKSTRILKKSGLRISRGEADHV